MMAIINMYIGKPIAEEAKWQTKTITPTANAQYVSADDGYAGLAKVIVKGDADLIANNIKKGVTIFGITGDYE